MDDEIRNKLVKKAEQFVAKKGGIVDYMEFVSWANENIRYGAGWVLKNSQKLKAKSGWVMYKFIKGIIVGTQ